MAKKQQFDDFDFGGMSGFDDDRRGVFYFKSFGEAWGFAQWACAMAIIGIPVGVALVWGVYDEKNLFGVIGIAGRRAGGAMIQETTPVGEAMLNGVSGKQFRPGRAGNQDLQELRPVEPQGNGR